MRIESSLPVTTPAVNATAEGGSKVGMSKAAPRDADGTDAAGFNPTSDLTQLLALVKQAPDVRADVVQDVQGRAAAGELTSRTAAVDTAAALLDNQS